MVDPALIDIFKGEASEILENIENDLVQLEENQDSEVINRLFRYYHTLKGSSGITGLDDIYEFTHHLENILDSVRSGKLMVDRVMIDLLLGSVDWIRSQIFSAQEGYNSAAHKEILLEQIQKLKTGEKPFASAVKESVPKDVRFVRVKATFRSDIFLFGLDPLIIMEDFFALGEIVENRVYKESVPPLSEIDPEKCYIHWIAVIKTQSIVKEIENVFLFVKGDNDIEITDITESFSDAAVNDEKRKIGDILLLKGIITESELNEVLNDQEHQNLKIGELVVKKGFATDKDL